MIITRYLVKEALKNQLIFLLILMLTFVCQKLVKIFSAVVNNEIPTNLVLPLLGLGMPEMAHLILPLSLFFGLLITFSKLYTESEIIIMHACGLSRMLLIKVAMILALFTSIITVFNLAWIEPWSFYQQKNILAKVKVNPNIIALAKGQFQQMNNGNLVLFIENISNDKFNNIFLVRLHSSNNIYSSIVVADSGHITYHKNGSQTIILNNGTHFEITKKFYDIYITTFQYYQTTIGYHTVKLNPNSTEQICTFIPWNNDNNCTKIELHWRLTLIFTLFIMALMVVPLSTINIRNGRFIYMSLAMLLYLIFFLVQSFIRSNGSNDKFNSTLWMWLINIFYLLLASLLNLQDTIFMRRMRVFFMYKKMYKERHDANIRHS